MGQRANYILIENGKQQIYYNHWRAESIASDLYLGEKKFIDFVRQCTIVEQMMEEVWLEGIAVVDLDKKDLHFWGIFFADSTTVHELYLKNLSTKWKDWGIYYAYRGVCDIEKVLKIDYTSKQEIFPLGNYLDIDLDTVSEWLNTYVIIKTEKGYHVAIVGDNDACTILSFGLSLITRLQLRASIDFPLENKTIYDTVFIDTIEMRIIAGRYEFGLQEKLSNKWQGYNIQMGDFRYVEVLRKAGISTISLTMSDEKAKEEFEELVKVNPPFDPFGFAKQIVQTSDDVQFNPVFFDTVSPASTLFERTKNKLHLLFKRK